MDFSKFVRKADRHGWRWLASFFIFLAYQWKREKSFRSASYVPHLGLWEYHIGDSFFVSREASWFCSENYFLENLKKYSAHFYVPRPGDTVLDVGAGVGEETLPFSKLVGPAGKIYAVEANPLTFSVLAYLVRKNNLFNVQVLQVAIADQAGIAYIENESKLGVGNSIGNGSSGSVPVRAVTLDELIAEHALTRVDLLKVNIEGAEQLLIRGFAAAIPNIRHIAISCHDFRFLNGEGEFFKTRDTVVNALAPYFHLTQQHTGDPVRDFYIYGTNRQLQSTDT